MSSIFSLNYLITRCKFLSRTGARGDSGTSPTLGIWRSWNISYVAGDVPLEVAFVFYPVVGLVVFETRVPLAT